MRTKKAGSLHKSCETLRINVTLWGFDIPRWFAEWRRRGLVKSTSDAIIQAFRLYQERLVELDIKEAQLKNLRRNSEEESGSPE